MLRLTLLLLVLANAGYYAWSHGSLRVWGFAPVQQSEPQRLEQQIRPQSIRILRADEARHQGAPSDVLASTGECLQVGPLDEVQVAGLKSLLEPWPTGSWAPEPVVEPGRWIIYMGKYATAENTARKKAELRQIGVSFEALTDPWLEPGLSLGAFATRNDASRQLEWFLQRGVRSARVVHEGSERRGQLLKFSASDNRLRPRLDEVRAALTTQTLRPCR